jgi:AmmeMemoRadiSam system protein A
MNLSESDKGVLILGAREAIQSLFVGAVSPVIDYAFYPNLKNKMGAFVTLIKDNLLRGCIGYLISEKPVYQTVCEAAKQAAVNDPRFPPLTYPELGKIYIEISVLSPMQKIESYQDIEIGVHGIMLEEGRYRAVLLPQVAVEQNFSREQFLSALCEKAGMPDYSWESGLLNIKTFTAQVFSEFGNRKRTNEQL